MTQEALAAELGVRPESVNRWERGKLGLRRTSILALAGVLPGLVTNRSKSGSAKAGKSLKR